MIETPTLWEFIHEYLHHYVAIDGALARTLKLLVARPGKLTTEYLAGRRARYIKPLQLYLSITFVFFIALHLFGGPAKMPADADARAGGKAAQSQGLVIFDDEPSDGRATRTNDADRKASGLGRWLESRPEWAALAARWKAKEQQYASNTQPLEDKMFRYAPYGVFCLVPIVALLLRIMYRRRKLRYGAHLVFAFHLHAFVFLTFLISLLPFDIGGWIALAIFVYLVTALKQMYGGRWFPQVLRSMVLVSAYTMFTIATILLVFLAAFLA
ncbi:MAG TPA: DUF3667 domain-containing protein [Paucimonas sp.]|nr:DUF3667 domain-containing protein [Paucimonas sp.]